MKIKIKNTIIVVQNIWTTAKRKWYWIIIGIIVLFIFQRYVLEQAADYLDDKFYPKPSILANIVIYQNIDLASNGTSINESVFLLGFLGEQYFSLYWMNAEDKKNIDDWGVINLQTFPYCSDCKSYNFRMRNEGKRIAQEVIIDLHSTSKFEITVPDPKMVHKQCEGMYNECRIVLEDISNDNLINFEMVTRENSDLNIINCVADEKYQCKIRFVYIKTAPILFPEHTIVVYNNHILEYPNRNDFEVNTLYYYDPNEIEWIMIPGLSPMSITETITLQKFLNRNPP